MSGNIKLNTPSSGSVTISAADTASNLTVTVPAATDTLVNLSSSQTLSNKTLSNPAFTGSPSGGTFTSTTITAANSNTVEATSGPTSTQLAGQRNKIINGAMMIDQRNAGAAVTANTSTSGSYITDRFREVVTAGTGVFTVQQNASAPVGFVNSLKATVTTAYSVTGTDRYEISQLVEGYNIADLAWGTANAKTVTLSFWVRSSLTGTFGGVIQNANADYNYPFSYAISSADTWTQVSITVTGATSGTWATDNTQGLKVTWSLGCGSTRLGTAGSWSSTRYEGATGQTQVIGTNGATFYITGVQLEKGATATPFENRLYGTELALCQRYLPCITAGGSTSAYFGMGSAPQTIQGVFVAPFTVPARVAPTGLVASSASVVSMADFINAAITGSSVSFLLASSDAALINLAVTGAVQFRPYGAYINNASGSIYFTGCEL